MGTTPIRQLTGSVLKAFDVLECIETHGTPLSPAEIANELGISRPTAHRLLVTMAERGWVTKSPQEPTKYLIGYRILQMAGAVLHSLDIRTVARPYMQQLSAKYDESVRLFLLDGDEVVLIDQVLCSRPLQSFLPLGERGELHSRAVGKALLAHLPDEKIAGIARTRGLKPRTSHTLTSLTQLRKEIERTRKLGYGIVDQEDIENLRAVGAAILNFQGVPTAGLAISGLVSHMTEKRMALLGEAIRDTAAQISKQLGCKQYKFGLNGGSRGR
jgi:IclR family transcriptional regulator, KDG regulon repressor